MNTAETFRGVYRQFMDGDERLRCELSEFIAAHLSRVMESLPSKNSALEIGCFEGSTTLRLLNSGIRNITVVDPFSGSPEHSAQQKESLRERFDQNTRHRQDRIEVIADRSVQGLSRLNAAGRAFDLIYIDGSHDSRDVMMDAVLSWQMLNPGGIMVFDDYLWNYYEEPYRNPKPAIDFFIRAFAPDLTILETHYQVSVQRNP